MELQPWKNDRKITGEGQLRMENEKLKIEDGKDNLIATEEHR